MGNKDSGGQLAPHTAAMRRILILAQLLALLAYALGLQFLHQTTGGTLFLFSTVAPLLVGAAIVGLILVIIHEIRRRHSLFAFENYTPGQIIFRQGDEGDRAYFIHSGEVEVVREDRGSESVLARLTKGQYFGEMALIRNQPRNATVRAVTNVKLAVLGKRNFLVMLSVLPSTQDDILKTVHQRAMEAAK
jgi:cyclic nucleotide-binding protein